ncbi:MULTISPECIES: phage tail protein [unclassified Nocardia]|uniref:Gp37-like protein n=1 Tax=unclassified Nocardia TaxID=2637762 RepID=UPI00278C4320|nr:MULTISPECIES: phage tail protein [unclassified Nocardia]
MSAPVWDPVAETRRMDALERAEAAEVANPGVLVRFWDKFMREEGEEHSYLSLEFSDKVNTAGGLRMVCPRDMTHFDHLFNNEDGEDATIPITVNVGEHYRWDGYVTKASIVRDENGVETVDIEAIHCWNHVATICCWASPFAPILAQFPRHHILFGPTRTIACEYLMTNLIRRQAANWGPAGGWANAPDGMGAGNVLFPIAVVPVDGWRDTTKWSAGSARFHQADQLLVPMLTAADVQLEARFFIPGEDEQPAPDYYWLSLPTVVLELKDKSGVTGPTGTLIDGLISFVEDFLDDGTTPVRYPNLNSTTEYEAVYGQPGPLGTVRNFPWVWYREGEYSGIGPAEVALHKPTATDVIVGGKSPGWVNAGIEIAIKNALAWLGLLIGVPGLDSLYQGQLDDVFLAWMVYSNAERIRRAGPYAFREMRVTGSDKAFTLAGVVAGVDGLHKTRGYTSKKVSIDPYGAPYRFGKDYELGDQIGFELGDKLFTDFVTEVTFVDTRDVAARLELVIGDGSDEEDTLVKAWGRMGSITGALTDLFSDVGADLDLIIF